MVNEEKVHPLDVTKADLSKFKGCYVGCLVLTHDNKIVLQKRTADAPTFPSRVSTFGGGIEKNEAPIDAIIRELNEELGAIVTKNEITFITGITELETNHSELLYLYFWHDVRHTITGCYEGSPLFYENWQDALKNTSLLDDVRWILNECHRRGLI